jgi:hypothetical protein
MAVLLTCGITDGFDTLGPRRDNAGKESARRDVGRIQTGGALPMLHHRRQWQYSTAFGLRPSDDFDRIRDAEDFLIRFDFEAGADHSHRCKPGSVAEWQTQRT